MCVRDMVWRGLCYVQRATGVRVIDKLDRSGCQNVWILVEEGTVSRIVFSLVVIACGIACASSRGRDDDVGTKLGPLSAVSRRPPWSLVLSFFEAHLL